jgi:hypothetical protein
MVLAVEDGFNEDAGPAPVRGPREASLQTAVASSENHDGNLGATLRRSPRGARILAKSIYRELRGSGLEERELLAIATQLIGLVAQDIRDGE